MTTLKDFTRDSLLQVCGGVAEAKLVNPNIGVEFTALGKQEASCTAADGSAGVLVDFDVAVTAVEKTGNEAGGGVAVVHVFNAGGKVSTEVERSSVSRIRFSVPVVFSPRQKSS